MQPVSDYIKWARGRKIDTDGCPSDNPYQCADVIKLAMTRCWDVKGFTFTSPSNPHGYAKGLFLYFDEHPELKGKFVKIENTPTFVPKLGDIVEWGTCEGVTGKAGHTALAEGINEGTTRFVSLDQNWGGKHYCTDVRHSYTGVLGVIRPLLKCTLAALNVRSGPGTSYPIVQKNGEDYVLPKGALVKPLEYKGSWARIGESCWVSSNYLG